MHVNKSVMSTAPQTGSMIMYSKDEEINAWQAYGVPEKAYC